MTANLGILSVEHFRSKLTQDLLGMAEKWSLVSAIVTLGILLMQVKFHHVTIELPPPPGTAIHMIDAQYILQFS